VSDEAVAGSVESLIPEAAGFVSATQRRLGARRDEFVGLRHQRQAQVRRLPVGRGRPIADISADSGKPVQQLSR